ncbi:MAG TPA: hypothetical protein VEY49_07755 [Solirubrobacteraceae bacterium]|jgi:hypothetical protein|nr:hypothetical protein [Solirubrobacteraceae bacterium]
MFRSLRRLPLFKLLAVAQLALLARRQFQQLDDADRRRLGELVRRGPRMEHGERDELRALLAKLEPRTFAAAAANAFSPVRLPRRFTGR